MHGFGVHVHTYIRTCTTHSCSQVSEAQEETPPENDSSSDSDSDDDGSGKKKGQKGRRRKRPGEEGDDGDVSAAHINHDLLQSRYAPNRGPV